MHNHWKTTYNYSYAVQHIPEIPKISFLGVNNIANISASSPTCSFVLSPSPYLLLQVYHTSKNFCRQNYNCIDYEYNTLTAFHPIANYSLTEYGDHPP